jgi:hypothetical protein
MLFGSVDIVLHRGKLLNEMECHPAQHPDWALEPKPFHYFLCC